MREHNESFEYTYSAEQQAEIEKIKAKYMPQTDSKLEQLRKLDASVTRPGTIVGIVIGLIGCLAFGGAMSMILVVGTSLLIPGIILGFVGIVLMFLAYPMYKRLTEKQKERIAPQILALTEEIGQ